jgi:hypothetical protein
VTAPTLVATYNSVWNTTTTPKTLSVTTQAGDRVLVVACNEDGSNTFGTPTGNSLTYTLVQSVTVADYTEVAIWTATDAAGGTAWTLSESLVGGGQWGFAALVFRSSDGFGASAATNVASGAPSLDVTTTQADSAVVAVSGDWNAGSGARTWRTINGVTPTAGNGLEKNYTNAAGSYTTYCALWDNVGAVGAKTTGLSAPTGQKYSIAAIEVKGVAGAAAGGLLAARRPARGLAMRGKRLA